jgi:[protein-PII] uridylyltransferase
LSDPLLCSRLQDAIVEQLSVNQEPDTKLSRISI